MALTARYFVPYSWTLHCPWCEWRLLVNPRGQRGEDQGSGYEAAMRMERHVAEAHGKTWPEFLQAEKPEALRALDVTEREDK